MRRIAIFSAAGAAAALMLMAPLTATAAPATNATPSLATCSSVVVDAVSGAEVYSGPQSFRVVDTVTRNQPYLCFGFSLGRRYTACGETNGNGWIKVEGDEGVIGYSPQACFADA